MTSIFYVFSPLYLHLNEHTKLNDFIITRTQFAHMSSVTS